MYSKQTSVALMPRVSSVALNGNAVIEAPPSEAVLYPEKLDDTLPDMSSDGLPNWDHRAPGSTPVVSIITVVRNSAESLAQTIKSVAKARTGLNVEYIIQDGSSTDGTHDILRTHEGDIDACISSRDSGIYDAMHRSLQQARGRWVYWLGADDLLHQDLGEMIESLKDPRAVYYGDTILASTGQRYFGPFTKGKLCLCNICHQAVFYPRETLGETPYDDRFDILADHALNLKLWGEGVPFHWVDTVVATFEDRGVSAKGDTAFEKERPRLIQRAFGLGYRIWFRYRMTRNAFKRFVLRMN